MKNSILSLSGTVVLICVLTSNIFAQKFSKVGAGKHGLSEIYLSTNKQQLQDSDQVFRITADNGDSVSYLFAIKKNGRVSIGDVRTTTPFEYKLYVQSGILTEKLRVANKGDFNWADFVFDKDYILMPLSDVENFIDKNQHLPGVPSGEEVKRDGIDVATMDATLLQKIEELTLYVISLQKDIEVLKKKLATQQTD